MQPFFAMVVVVINLVHELVHDIRIKQLVVVGAQRAVTVEEVGKLRDLRIVETPHHARQVPHGGVRQAALRERNRGLTLEINQIILAVRIQDLPQVQVRVDALHRKRPRQILVRRQRHILKLAHHRGALAKQLQPVRELLI